MSWVLHHSPTTGTDAALAAAAEAWVEAYGADEPEDYSTTDNRFLWAAEAAWAEAAAKHRVRRRAEAEGEALRASFVPPTPPAVGCFLYRLWSADQRLMYVGVSRCLRRRIAQHRRTWDETVWATVTWEEHPNAASMLAAEAAAIRDEAPLLNSSGAP